MDQPFAPKNDKIFCADCHDNNFAARCDGCQKPFRGGKADLISIVGMTTLLLGVMAVRNNLEEVRLT